MPVHLCRLLEGERNLQYGKVLAVRTDDLQAHRQSRGREAAGHGDRRRPGRADVIARAHPVEVGLELDAVDTRRVGHADRERQNLGHGRRQKIVALHEFPHAMKKPRALHFRLADLTAAETCTLLDVPHDGIFHDLAMRFEQRTQHEMEMPGAQHAKDLLGVTQIRRRLLDDAPEVLKDAPLRIDDATHFGL